VNGLEKFIKSFYRIIKPINRVASSVGMILLAAMMFLTAADVIMRYSLNKPIQGTYELTQFMLAITVAVGLSYCAVEKGHVTIDLVTTRMPRRMRAIFDCVTGLLGLIVAGLMAWQTCIHITMLQKSGLVSTVLLIPMYPFVAIVAFGIAFFCVVLIAQFLEFIIEGMKQ
jgi:TRAP-type C4-dicarboxylate transport system permease small subunit